MKLRKYIELHTDEIEVWDECVDIAIPYYGNSRFDNKVEMSYNDNEEDHYLFVLEYWLLSLEVTHTNESSVCVDVFHELQHEWDHILECMEQDEDYANFLNRYEDHHDDEMIADMVEDVFNVLAYGRHSMAKDFCFMLNIQDFPYAKIEERINNNEIPVVGIEECPDCYEIYYIPLRELTEDHSQGTGNVTVHYIYVPALDIVCSYVNY